MKKLLIIASLAVFAIPLASLAQTSASCGMPVSPTTAADWVSTISCLQSRISNLESRISALESRNAGQTTPGYYSGTQTSPSTPIGIPATPVTPSNGGSTNYGGPIGVPAIPVNGGTTNTCDSTTNVCIAQQGSVNEGVKAIQTFLRSAGTFNTAPTGYFGTITKNAVQQFQAAQGLTQTGMVDQATLNKIQTLAPQVAPSVAPTLQQVKTSQ